MNKEYINEKMKEFAMNIDEFEIDQLVKDSDGKLCRIINKSQNSIELYIEKKSKEGINCTQWYSMNNFNRRFKK